MSASLRTENERLRTLLREARQYVADAGSDEDSETQRNSAELLRWIDDTLRHPLAESAREPMSSASQGEKRDRDLVYYRLREEEAKRLAEAYAGMAAGWKSLAESASAQSKGE